MQPRDSNSVNPCRNAVGMALYYFGPVAHERTHYG